MAMVTRTWGQCSWQCSRQQACGSRGSTSPQSDESMHGCCCEVQPFSWQLYHSKWSTCGQQWSFQAYKLYSVTLGALCTSQSKSMYKHVARRDAGTSTLIEHPADGATCVCSAAHRCCCMYTSKLTLCGIPERLWQSEITAADPSLLRAGCCAVTPVVALLLCCCLELVHVAQLALCVLCKVCALQVVCEVHGLLQVWLVCVSLCCCCCGCLGGVWHHAW